MQLISGNFLKLPSNQEVITYNRVGNFIPPEWRYLTDPSGRPLSKTSRQLLSLIVSCFESRTDLIAGELQEGYYFFEQQLGVCQRRVRQCFVELQRAGFITLELLTVIKYHIKCRNILSIKLLKDFKNLRAVNSQTDTKNFYTKQKDFSSETEENFSPTRKNFQAHNIIDNSISILESRSSESDFLKNNFFENDCAYVPEQEFTRESGFQSAAVQNRHVESQNRKEPQECHSDGQALPDVSSNWLTRVATKAKDFCRFKKKLEEFHPLTDDDAWLLQLHSGREFNLGFINKLLLKLAKQYPDHKFPSKKAVLNYMTKALTYELREANKVNNDGFRFKLDSDSKAREDYLQKVEYSLDTSQTSQLRRKIAAVFEPEVAYKLLTSCSFNDPQGDCYKLPLIQDIVISETLQGAMLKEARAVYGNSLKRIEIIAYKTCNNSFADKKIAGETVDNYAHLQELDSESVWFKVRKYLTETLGAAIDKSWFSRLELVAEDKVNKKIVLKAQTPFIRDWINQNYQAALERAFSLQDFSFEMVKP
jgi:hypothetical protein